MPDISDAAKAVLTSDTKAALAPLTGVLAKVDEWTEDAISEAVKADLASRDLKLGKIGPGLRAALTGSTSSPSIFLVLTVLGRENTLVRLQAALTQDT